MNLVQEKDDISIGSRKATVEVERYRCDSCDEVFYTRDQAMKAQRDAAGLLRLQEGLLAPEEVKHIRQRLVLSQANMERLLGVGPKTVVRWERGTVFQNTATDQLLRIIRDVPEAFVYLAQQRGLEVKSIQSGVGAECAQKIVDMSEWRKSPKTTFKLDTNPVTLTNIKTEAMR